MKKHGEMTVWLAELDSNDPMLLGTYDCTEHTIRNEKNKQIMKEREESDES